MRVVQVSAHYPPNFVSGGTLVPQRIARAVADAGHESFVYAGYLDPKRTPMETWSETDGVVTVRWVVTTPWTGGANPRNTANPPVEADFRQWLADVRPDVVHLHSLQALGGALVRAAKDSGAAVVVTMHDFWWLCARQFLATTDLRPCSLVVDCGVCPCQVDHEWLTERNAALAPHLAAADIVLAPSASAARVLVANGLAPEKLRVDENGVPESVANAPGGHGEGRHGGTRTHGENGPLRLMYAGGPAQLKGVDVLYEVTRQLADLPGWTLDMYGCADAAPAGLPEPARPRPPFRPEDLAEVLAAHDVLVLPSIARESHSILTREALDAGLAVVCTDTLGPEEAVTHDHNGLVVPAADPDALAAALRGLITQPERARTLMGKGSASPVRGFEDQAAGLLRLYADLVVAPPVSGDAIPPLQHVVFVVGIQGAPLRYRAHLPAEALRMLGVRVDVRHYRDPELPELVGVADAVVFYRVPATNQVLDVISGIRAADRHVPVLFDVDDLIFDPDLRDQVHGLAALGKAEQDLWWRGVARYRTTMEAADMFIGSTEELCRHATTVTGLPARRFANGVGTLLAQRSDAALRAERTAGPLRIGYFSGTTTHDADWAAVEPAVIVVLEQHPELELWLGGHLTPTVALDRYASRVKRIPFTSWLELPALLRDVDVCLAPLTADSRFNEAKSAIKWLEAALVETPVVASPTEPFREAVEHGRTGFLASTEQEWTDAISRLLGDTALRRRIGTQARREALLRWSPHVQGSVYLANLHAAVNHVRQYGSRQATTWVPVADDEPASRIEAYVEPYGSNTARRRSTSVVWVVRTVTAVRRVYRDQGARAVFRKATRAVAERVR